MGKRIFLLFIALLSLAISGVVAFIQSPRFTQFLKTTLIERMPANLGIVGNFKGIEVNLWPPGLSLLGPKVEFEERNFARIPAGSAVSADRIRLKFYPLQMFSGSIRVNEISIENGDVNLKVDIDALSQGDKKIVKSKKSPLPWDQLLQIYADSVRLENTQLRVEATHPDFSTSLMARNVLLSQWSGKGGLGYALDLQIEDWKLKAPQFSQRWIELRRLETIARVNVLGVQLDSLRLAGTQYELELAGIGKGNVLESKKLPFVGTARFRGQIEEVFSALGLEAIAKNVDAKLNLTAQVEGDLFDPLHSLNWDAQLDAGQVKAFSWEADRVRLNAKGKPDSEHIKLDLGAIEIESQEVPRKAPLEGGKGGTIRIAPTSLRIGKVGLLDPLQLAVDLKQVHLHWPGSLALRQLYPLDFRVDGHIDAQLRLSGPEETRGAEVDLNIVVPEFSLDTAKWKVSKSISPILNVKNVAVKGKARIDSTGFYPESIVAYLPNSTARLTGSVEFEEGSLDLRAGGNFDLSDVGRLLGNDIRGKGTVFAHIHGPSKRVLVDFDADLVDSLYLGLALGDIKGRVTLDEDPLDVFFTGFVGKKGTTEYTAEGKINGEKSTIDLTAQIKKGAASELIALLKSLVTRVEWFPIGLKGALSGSVHVGGGLDTNELQISADLVGADFEHWGERLKYFTTKGGYDRGRFYLENFHAKKGRGEIAGRIEYDPKKGVNWDARTTGMQITDFEQFARLNIPFRGGVLIESKGFTQGGVVDSESLLRIENPVLKGVTLPSSDLRLTVAESVASLKGVLFGGQVRLDSQYSLKNKGKSHIRLVADQFDFSPAFLILNPKLIQDPELKGVVSGRLILDFKSGEIELASGSMSLSDLEVSKSGAYVQLLNGFDINVDSGVYRIVDAQLGTDEGEAALNLRGDRGRLDGTVRGTVDLALLELLTPAIQRASGGAQLDLRVGGQLKQPDVRGQVSVNGGEVRVNGLESPIERVQAKILIKEGTATVESGSAESAGGLLSVGGDAEFFWDRWPELDLWIDLADPKLKIFPFQYAQPRGRLTVTGSELPYDVEGQLKMEQALSREPLLKQRGGELPKMASYLPPASGGDSSGTPIFQLNIGVQADRGIWVKNDLLDSEWKGKMTVIGTIETPRVIGEAELVQGRLSFNDRVFQIQSARVSFDNPKVVNPSFSVVGTTEVGQSKIRMFTTGRMKDFRIELSSNPPMPEADIVQLLALGVTNEQLSRPGATGSDRSAVSQGVAASLLLQSLDFNRDIQQKTGLQIGVDEARNSQLASSQIRAQSPGDLTGSPRIVIKREVAKNLNVTIGSTVGLGGRTQQEVNAELKVTPGFSVIGVWNTFEQGSQTELPQSFGVDVKVQKRFK